MDVDLDGEGFDAWESTGSLITTGSLHSGIKSLSFHFVWSPPPNSIDIDSLGSGFELVLQKAEVLDPLLEKTFTHLTILSLELDYSWPSDLKDEEDHLRTRFSQSAIEGALRMKLPKTSQRVRLDISVSHYVR